MDMVVASYVIGELRSESERRRVVDALWQRTGGVLVLLEPGTPVGSANIREARAQVLHLPELIGEFVWQSEIITPGGKDEDYYRLSDAYVHLPEGRGTTV